MYNTYKENSRTNKQVMTVYGNGVLSIKPDTLKVNIGVVTRDVELSRAQQENATLTQRVIQSLLQLGLPQEKIQTTDYRIQPIYEYKEGTQTFIGYEVSNYLSIIVDQVEQVGIMIDTAVKNGANRVGDIQFSISNDHAYYQQALKKALENAFSKAHAIVRPMGLSLHPIPLQIIEHPIERTPIPFQTLYSVEQTNDVTTPIEPGQIEVKAKLEVKFYYY